MKMQIPSPTPQRCRLFWKTVRTDKIRRILRSRSLSSCRLQKPSATFFLSKQKKNCIDLNRISLRLDVKKFNPDGKDAATPDNLLSSNNTPHSLFSHVELFLNGKLISSSKNNYHHNTFVVTELTTDPVNKRTWTVCQGYRYRLNKEKNLEVKNKIMKKIADYGMCSLHLKGAPHVDFLDCEWLVLPIMTLHTRLY